NRVTAINHYNGTGTALATYVYSYDGASVLTSEVVNGTRITYSYDAADQLTADGTNTYTYDANGNRNNGSWTVSTGNQLTGAGTVNWDVWADLDGSSSLTTRYLRGDVVDQLFARIGSDGTAGWLLADHLGSVRGVTDNSGLLKDTIAYDGWGNITSESDATW